jgi:predicted RNA-binding Zn ribbon-like protein
MINPLPRRRAADALHDGGNPALNFINTYKRNYKGIYTDSLRNYEGLLQWCEATGVICWDRLLQLELEMRCYEQEAAQVFERALSVRRCLAELFSCLVSARPVHEHVLHFFNQVAGEVKGHLHYAVGPRGMEQFWINIHEELPTPLWFIVSEAMQLIDANRVQFIKQCPLCGSLFLDVSKNGNRKWCNPNTCGSVRKSVRYYEHKTFVLEGSDMEISGE